MKYLKLLVVLFVFVIAVVFNTERIGISKEIAPEFSLMSTDGEMVESEDIKGKIVLMIFANRKGGPEGSMWCARLIERYKGREDIVPLFVATIKGVPFFISNKTVIKLVKKEVFTAGLLDWKGKITDAFGAPDKGVTLVLVDKDWTIKLMLDGYQMKYVKELDNEIAKLSMYNENIAEYEKAAADDTQSFAAQLNLGRAYITQQKYEEAIKYIEKAAVLDSENKQTNIELSRANEGLNMVGEVIEKLSSAIKLDLENEYLHYWIAEKYEKIEDNDKAIEEYKLSHQYVLNKSSKKQIMLKIEQLSETEE